MCEICLFIERELKLKGIVVSGSRSGPTRMSSILRRLSATLNTILSPIRLIARFLRDTRPATHSFVTAVPSIPAPVSGFIATPNSEKSPHSIIDGTNPEFTPDSARRYIEIFSQHTYPGFYKAVLNGELVFLKWMTDEEALVIARHLLSCEVNSALIAIQQAGVNT